MRSIRSHHGDEAGVAIKKYVSLTDSLTAEPPVGFARRSNVGSPLEMTEEHEYGPLEVHLRRKWPFFQNPHPVHGTGT